MPRARTVSLRQLDELLKLMEGNTHLANGRTIGGAPGHQQAQKFWASVANILNRIPAGTVKGPDQWKTYWHDVKYRARKRAGEVAAPPGMTRVRPLTHTETRIIDITRAHDDKPGTVILEEMLLQPDGSQLSSSTWVEEPPSPASLPPRSPPPPAPPAPPAPADGDPLCESGDSDDSETMPKYMRMTQRQRWPQPLEEGGFTSDARREWTHSTITRTQDRIARTQDRIAQTLDKISQTQDRIAQTQDKLSQNQDNVPLVYHRIANALEAITPQFARIPALLDAVNKIPKQNDND